ncbi:MAG: hypothetical protein NC409_12520 [Clostridium sp.]|nr:hypothetical protein [Clostridium sp.]
MMNDAEERLLREMTIGDLAEKHQLLAQSVGMDGLRNLVKNFGGGQIYIPKNADLLREMKVRAIRKEFDGLNLKQLAIKYDVSNSFVYNVIRDKIAQGIKHDVPGQTDFYDLLMPDAEK